ncbi:hypothetical protein N7478_000567 [Penicillium angulare]|uniref:uncharacterized protein n=1 Tax=Penicillium angulare TaxID=116970 RepID=UPI002542445C|nr:uncharacterized protein N7478_000567 [Penicillium angulare]KAJ5291316.1 hypothetical protein N7478_000567 [Penicillium angulare]
MSSPKDSSMFTVWLQSYTEVPQQSKAKVPYGLDGDGWRHLHLLPLSLIGLSLEETIQVHSIVDSHLYLLSPKPLRYMPSLFRYLLRLPIANVSRRKVERDLITFIGWYILHDLPPDTPRSIVDAETVESHESRVERGLKEMKGWDWGEVDELFLEMAEPVVRDCRSVKKLTDLAGEPPASTSMDPDDGLWLVITDQLVFWWCVFHHGLQSLGDAQST